MTHVQPLSLDLIRPRWVADVPSPPHDALTPAQRRQHLQAFPLSYMGVTRAPEDVDPDDQRTAEELLVEGRRSLERLMTNDVFRPATDPGYYAYRLTVDDHQQTGVVCGVTVDAYDSGLVRVHERIKTGRADHLANHLRVVGAQSSPIALALRDDDNRLRDLLSAATRAEPDLDFVTSDGLHQQIWPVADSEVVGGLTEAVSADPLYLIDGHHRAAAAALHRRRSGDDPSRPGDRWVLSTVFPAHEMVNTAFHRVVSVASPEDLEEELAARFDLEPVPSVESIINRSHGVLAFGRRSDDGGIRWALLRLPQPDESATVVDRLEQSQLADVVLGPVLGLDGSNPGSRLRYRPGPANDPLGSLDLSDDEVVFAMHPVTMDELFAVADQGLVMPPKSTYFSPKVRSGLFVHIKNRI